MTAVAAAVAVPASLPALAAPLPVAAPAVGPAAVEVGECATGESPAERRVEFLGSMRRVPGSEQMWMRFTLRERVGLGAFEKVQAPDLGVWHKSRPGVRRFSYRQGVVELAEGSAYRTAVRFRWYDADGSLVRRARRVSRSCRQPGVLPNLRVAQIGGRRLLGDRPGTVRYRVRLANRGASSAERVSVELMLDGSTLGALEVGALAPGQRRDVFVDGPACTTSVEARVDPSDTVRESSELDNARTVDCPTAQPE